MICSWRKLRVIGRFNVVRKIPPTLITFQILSCFTVVSAETGFKTVCFSKWTTEKFSTLMQWYVTIESCLVFKPLATKNTHIVKDTSVDLFYMEIQFCTCLYALSHSSQLYHFASASVCKWWSYFGYNTFSQMLHGCPDPVCNTWCISRFEWDDKVFCICFQVIVVNVVNDNLIWHFVCH